MIRTVTGDIPDEALGVASAHEHLLIDLRPLVALPEIHDPSFFRPLTAETRYLVSEDPYALLDNAHMSGEADAILDLEIFRACGGSAVVDVTLDEIGRDPLALRRISERSGVAVVMGCGHYVDGALPGRVRSMSEDELAREMIGEIERGVNGTGVRAGVIGEIGTSEIVTPDEWKNVRAAALASAETGCGVHVHTALWGRNGPAVAREMTALGVRPEKIAIDHLDVDLRPDYLYALADLGVMLEFDNFGKEFYVPSCDSGLLKGRFAYDLERARAVAELVKRGHAERVLLANDICLKSMMVAHGGNGYAHLIRHVRPMLADCGIGQADIEKMFKVNPTKFLSRR